METIIQMKSLKTLATLFLFVILISPTDSYGQLFSYISQQITDAGQDMTAMGAYILDLGAQREQELIDKREQIFGVQNLSQENQDYTWCDVRTNISNIAIMEYAKWSRRGEHTPGMQDHLANYYASIPKDENNWGDLPKYQKVNWQELSAKAAQNKVPWCAAFTSYVMRQAGITEEYGFEFSRRNLTFIVQAARNRTYHAQDYTKMFWLFDVEESYAKIEVGDIICMNRKRKNGKVSNHTFDNLITKYPQEVSLEDVKDVSHTEIVIGIHTNLAGKQYAVAIGGNEYNTVNIREIELENGKIKKSGNWIFGVVKLMDCNKYF